ncbi:hypothetical protein BHK98_09180 [Hornefia porci]|uniref:HTH cro/C1-type domain-containing protein n=2 Tax=Hornefia porci TaxID=2652292 RepID=A0A1Q9JJ40_9FIRM|nr:hypothetical protein BHK98_09180 [Hornefia porci]
MVQRYHKIQMQRLYEAHPELQYLPAAVHRIARKREMPITSIIAASGLSSSGFYAAMRNCEDFRRLPNLGTFFSLSDALGVSPEKLLSEMRVLAAEDSGQNKAIN